MQLAFDPGPDDAYRSVPSAVAHWADEVFDWLEESPVNVRARTARFNNGLWAVRRTIGDEDWLILWEEVDDIAYVRFLGRTFSL
jgi:hypothetical protein